MRLNDVRLALIDNFTQLFYRSRIKTKALVNHINDDSFVTKCLNEGVRLCVSRAGRSIKSCN